MGALQEIFAGNTSTDIVTSNHTWLPYNLFVEQQHANHISKSGPVKIIAMGKTEVDRILDELGVVHRDRGNSQDVCSIVCGGNSSNTGRVVSVVKNKAVPKVKPSRLQPKDLTANDIQECMDGDIKYFKIMEMYGFSSERYFKETIKKLGYRLLRGELWVMEDKLWLN